MMCLGCGSPEADDVNVSVNISETEPTKDVHYTGTTEYGDPTVSIGTVCQECFGVTLTESWREDVLGAIAKRVAS